MESMIVTNPKILSGMPVIAGTRIPVSRILHLLKEGYTIEAIHEDYPQVAVKVLEAVVDEAAEIVNRQGSTLSI